MTTVKKRIMSLPPLSKALAGVILVLGLGILGASPALALGLDQARSAGQVCEGADGLLKAVTPTPEVKALVDSTNSQRLRLYQEAARKEGVTLLEMQAVSGVKLRERHGSCR